MFNHFIAAKPESVFPNGTTNSTIDKVADLLCDYYQDLRQCVDTALKGHGQLPKVQLEFCCVYNNVILRTSDTFKCRKETACKWFPILVNLNNNDKWIIENVIKKLSGSDFETFVLFLSDYFFYYWNSKDKEIYKMYEQTLKDGGITWNLATVIKQEEKEKN